jgi:hypothetical protein
MARSLAPPSVRDGVGLERSPHPLPLPEGEGVSWLEAGGLAALSAGLTWNLLRDRLPLSLDSSSQYWPWYAYLGQSLRIGRIPAWNMSAFGGAPFAADPLSGWTYVPAMSMFGVLPQGTAITTFVFVHFLLAGLATCGLARALDLPKSAALLAAMVYASSGFFQFESVAAQPYVGVAAWLPVSLLGAERALRAGRADARSAWWCGAGFALSQVIAIWPGQGAYYAALTFVTWSAVRAFTAAGGPHRRVVRAVVHAGVPLAVGVALAVAGILPRLEFQSLSNLAHGYAAQDHVGGWQPSDFARLATPGSSWYVGVVALGLALVGLVALARRPPCLPVASAPFVILAVLWLAVLVLAASVPTPLHAALSAILPGFGGLQAHIPERILVAGYLAPALLAGLGFTVLRGARATGLPEAFRHGRLAHHWTAGLVAAAACLDLVVGGRLAVDRQVGTVWDPLARVADFDASLTQSGAARFLQAQPTPFRYLGYDGGDVPFTQRFADPHTIALLVNNSAMGVGLQDVQGYNAVHLARFDAYLKVLNAGRTQTYHDGQVFEQGLNSPLLDLLGVRFVVLPADLPLRNYPVAFQDDLTRVVERPTAQPRGWLVHDVRLASCDEALQMIASAVVDARRTALVEEALADPPSPSSAGGVTDHLSLLSDSPESQRWQVGSDAPGILVMSEVAYPAWAAHVDGQPARLLTADGLLRAVALPAGPHVVDVRYESATLDAGLAISLATLVGVAATVANLARTRLYFSGRAGQSSGTRRERAQRCGPRRVHGSAGGHSST